MIIWRLLAFVLYELCLLYKLPRQDIGGKQVSEDYIGYNNFISCAAVYFMLPPWSSWSVLGPQLYFSMSYNGSYRNLSFHSKQHWRASAHILGQDLLIPFLLGNSPVIILNSVTNFQILSFIFWWVVCLPETWFPMEKIREWGSFLQLSRPGCSTFFHVWHWNFHDSPEAGTNLENHSFIFRRYSWHRYP